jgi:hypothetical protein
MRPKGPATLRIGRSVLLGLARPGTAQMPSLSDWIRMRHDLGLSCRIEARFRLELHLSGRGTGP